MKENKIVLFHSKSEKQVAIEIRMSLVKEGGTHALRMAIFIWLAKSYLSGFLSNLVSLSVP